MFNVFTFAKQIRRSLLGYLLIGLLGAGILLASTTSVWAQERTSSNSMGLEFDFYIRNVAFSPDEKFALLSGSDTAVPGEIAVVDLEQMKIVASRKFETPVREAAIGSQAGDYPVFVFLEEKTKTMIGRTRHKSNRGELQQLDSRKLNTVLTLKDLALSSPLNVVGNEFVVLGQTVFKLPAMEPDGVRNAMSNPRVPGEGPSWAIKSHMFLENNRHISSYDCEHQIFDGVAWDTKFEKAKMLLGSGPFFGLGIRGDYTYHWGLQLQKSSGKVFSYRASERDLRGDKAFKLKLPPHSEKRSMGMAKNWILLPDVPATVLPVENVAEDAQSSASLAIFDLVSNTEVERLDLPLEGSHRHIRLFGHRDRILIALGKKIHVVPTSQLDQAKLKKPFRIDRSQSTFVLPEKRSAKLKYSVFDGKPPYRAIWYSSQKVYGKSTGNTVDFEVESFELYDRARQRALSRGSDNLENYLESTSDLFQKIVGRPSTGIPVMVPANVRVVDANGEIAMLHHAFLIELDRDIYGQAKPPGDSKRGIARGRERQSDNEELRKQKITIQPVDGSRNKKLKVLKPQKWGKQKPEPLEADESPTLPSVAVSAFKAKRGRLNYESFSPNGSDGFILQQKLSREVLLTRFDTKTFDPDKSVEPDFIPESVDWSAKQLVVQDRARDVLEYQDTKGRWRELDIPRVPKGVETRVALYRDCWLVNPRNLKPIKGLQLPGAKFRFHLNSDKAIGFPDQKSLELFDLKKNISVAKYNRKEIFDAFSKGLGKETSSFIAPQCELLGDGSSLLFCVSLAQENQHVLCRCTLDRKGGMLVDSFSDPFKTESRLRRPDDLFSISPDQKFVAVGFELPRHGRGMMGLMPQPTTNGRGAMGKEAGAAAPPALVPVGKDGVIGSPRFASYGIHLFDMTSLGYPVATFKVNNGGPGKVSVAWDEKRKLFGICSDREIHIVGGGEVQSLEVQPNIIGGLSAKRMSSIPLGFFVHGTSQSLLIEPKRNYNKWDFGAAAN